MSAPDRIQQFKLGSRVRLSKLGRARCPTMVPRGTVVGFSRRSTALQVLMDGNKTSVLLHLSYLDLARQPAQRKAQPGVIQDERPSAVVEERDSPEATT